MSVEPAPDVLARVTGRSGTLRAPTVLLVAIWLLGLAAIGAVIEFERRVDDTRQSQVVIQKIRNQQGTLLRIAFSPATASAGDQRAQADTDRQLLEAERVLGGSVTMLADLGHSEAPKRIAILVGRYVEVVDRLAALVADGRSRPAALELGWSQRPGGLFAELTAELDRADESYGAVADRSRTVASVGTFLAIGGLLIAFSIAFAHLVRARRRSHQQATTDALTGLGNRRKLFADMNGAGASPGKDGAVVVGIFDLDGFKDYNDTFGHPAGDALLARLGTRLEAAVGRRGNAYRIGGDEFVVTTAVAGSARLLMDAKAALCEQGHGFTIGCSVGSAPIDAGTTLDDALHVADQRLYANKRTVRGLQTQVKDALLQVLAEQSAGLVTTSVTSPS